jgi:hypothetical protein
VSCLPPPNSYSYVREENSDSTRKFVEIYLLFTCISNLILAIHTQSVNEGTFLRQWRKVQLVTKVSTWDILDFLQAALRVIWMSGRDIDSEVGVIPQ